MCVYVCITFEKSQEEGCGKGPKMKKVRAEVIFYCADAYQYTTN